MVISTFISSILILILGIWASLRLESSMNLMAEKQLIIEPNKFSYKMWKDMPVTMYQRFSFFNLTNWNQVKSIGQKPRFVEVGPYVYKTIWTKADINFIDEEKLVSYTEKKQWIFDPILSKGHEDDQIWTINTPLMTALALIQNAPVITRNVVSVILDGLGEGAFIKRNIRSLLFEGYSDLIVSVGPLFDRRFANFNGKFAYLYNKNDSVDGTWTVSTGSDDLANLNKIFRFQNNIVNMTSTNSRINSQGFNEVKPECLSAWNLDQATNGQLFSPFSQDLEQLKLLQELHNHQNPHQQQQQQTKPKSRPDLIKPSESSSYQQTISAPKKFFGSRNHFDHLHFHSNHHNHQQQDLVPNPFINQKVSIEQASRSRTASTGKIEQETQMGKYIFYPDLCRPIHLISDKQIISPTNKIKAIRFLIDPRMFMNSSQIPANKCFEMNPRPPLANTLAATINSVTGANVALPSLTNGASSPFHSMFNSQQVNQNNHHNNDNPMGLFERSNHPNSFLNNALQSLGGNNQDQQTSATNNAPISRLSRVRQLFSNIVSQRMSASGPSSLFPSLSSGPTALLMGNHHNNHQANSHFINAQSRNSPEDSLNTAHNNLANNNNLPIETRRSQIDNIHSSSASNVPTLVNPNPSSAPIQNGNQNSDRWITQFRFKWPRGVFSIGQCQLGAPLYASLPHFLDADEYYLEQVDGLKPNRSLHEFYIDIESTLHSIPIGAKARLQLNVATPELRFRNIPNAMIPVLWQEVTFDIHRPIATMLFWSFTMSSAIYKTISYALILIGSVLLLNSFIVCYRKDSTEGNSDPDSNEDRSFWNIRRNSKSRQNNQAISCGIDHIEANNQSEISNSSSNETSTSLDSNLNSSEFSYAQNLTHQNSIRHYNSNNNKIVQCNATPNEISVSPKQPSSRASSQCELVSSFGTTIKCAGCLLACLRHTSNNSSCNHLHEQQELTNQHTQNDNKFLVSKQILTSIDPDKDTLSSRESNSPLNNCASIYTKNQYKTTFKK